MNEDKQLAEHVREALMETAKALDIRLPEGHESLDWLYLLSHIRGVLYYEKVWREPDGAPMNEDKSTKEDYDNAIRTMCDIADRRAEALQEVFQRMMRRAIGAPEKQPEKETK